MNIKTFKKLRMTGNFHFNGDVDKNYLARVEEGQRLKIIAQMYESRIMATAQYLAITYW